MPSFYYREIYVFPVIQRRSYFSCTHMIPHHHHRQTRHLSQECFIIQTLAVQIRMSTVTTCCQPLHHFSCSIFGCNHRWRPTSGQNKHPSWLAQQFKILDPISSPALSNSNICTVNSSSYNLFPRREIKTHSVSSLGDIGSLIEL